MIRSMTSIVSTVSSFVAKGHQTMHHVSCSPSKIPYVGFSPVRLQTGIQPRPSLPPQRLKREVRIHRCSGSLYEAKAVASGSCYSPLSGSIDLPAPAIQSRGPWLACGLCCPAGSSLTMASSETLPPSRWLIFFVQQVFALRPRMGWVRELPQFAPRLFSFVPPSVPRQTQRLPLTVSSPLALAFAQSARARHLHSPTHAGSHVAVFTRLQSSLSFPFAAARRIASPSPARTSTFELSPPESPQRSVEYNYAGTQSIPATGLPPARHAALWAANGSTRIDTDKTDNQQRI
jgi:hypothetical protein